MHGLGAHDPGRSIDWSQTSDDYAVYRPGYPQSFYDHLEKLDIGTAKQDVLDLGTGTGVIARHFASRGARVIGVDIAAGQIEAAKQLAKADGLDIAFHVRRAEKTELPDQSFDVITAAQCFLYFDKSRAVAEIKRLLRPSGRLMTSYLGWLPRECPIARASEKLVLEHNPAWTAGDWSGDNPEAESWSVGEFKVAARFVYDEALPFTNETWRGRIRACRGVGATMSREEVAAFDADHNRLLQEIAGDEFTVLHRVAAFVYEAASS